MAVTNICNISMAMMLLHPVKYENTLVYQRGLSTTSNLVLHPTVGVRMGSRDLGSAYRTVPVLC